MIFAKYKPNRYTLLLFIVTCIGFVLRFYNIGQLPRILNRDEAAIAYNALLIKETGKDEWNKNRPLILESFGDYKLPGYPILTIISFSLFGYNDAAVRFPSALFGTLLIPLSYAFARIFKLKKRSSFLFSLFIALTPIFFFYSRISFEANVALTLFVFILSLLFMKVKKYRWHIDIITILLLLVAIFIYNTPLLLLPFITIALPFTRTIRKWKTWIIPTVGLTLLFVFSFTFFSQLSSQKGNITLFSNETVRHDSIQYRSQFDGIMQKILGNKYVYLTTLISKNFVSSFSPHFLVTVGGEHPWHQIPGHSHIYWTTYILGFTGIMLTCIQFVCQTVTVAKNNPCSSITKKRVLLLYILLVALIPSIITVDAPHATRSLLFIYLFILFSVIATEQLYSILQKTCSKESLLRYTLPFATHLWLVVLTILGFESYRYFKDYFTVFPNRHSESLRVGFDTIIQKVDAQYPHKPITVIEGDGHFYIMTAWYVKTNPHLFLNTLERYDKNLLGLWSGKSFGRYSFVGFPEDAPTKNTVWVQWDKEKEEWYTTEY